MADYASWWPTNNNTTMWRLFHRKERLWCVVLLMLLMRYWGIDSLCRDGHGVLGNHVTRLAVKCTCMAAVRIISFATWLLVREWFLSYLFSTWPYSSLIVIRLLCEHSWYHLFLAHFGFLNRNFVRYLCVAAFDLRVLHSNELLAWRESGLYVRWKGAVDLGNFHEVATALINDFLMLLSLVLHAAVSHLGIDWLNHDLVVSLVQHTVFINLVTTTDGRGELIFGVCNHYAMLVTTLLQLLLLLPITQLSTMVIARRSSSLFLRRFGPMRVDHRSPANRLQRRLLLLLLVTQSTPR